LSSEKSKSFSLISRCKEFHRFFKARFCINLPNCVPAARALTAGQQTDASHVPALQQAATCAATANTSARVTPRLSARCQKLLQEQVVCGRQTEHAATAAAAAAAAAS
jgi:hypothetical protein